MIVICDSCRADYNLDDAKVPPSGGFFKCKACGNRVQIPARGDAAIALPDAPTDAASNPPADTPIPLGGSAPTPPAPAPKPPTDAPIPLGGSAPTPPALAPKPPTDAPIPLGGSAPTPPATAPKPPAGAPIPLGGSAPAPPAIAPKPPNDAPIPLGGSAPTPPATAPKPPAGAPIPLGGSAPTPPATAPKPPAGAPIPLGGSAPAPPATAPKPPASAPSAPAAAPKPPASAPSAPAAAPKLPAGAAIPLASSTASVSATTAPVLDTPLPSSHASATTTGDAIPLAGLDDMNVGEAVDALEPLPLEDPLASIAPQQDEIDSLPLDDVSFDELPAAEVAELPELGTLPEAGLKELAEVDTVADIDTLPEIDTLPSTSPPSADVSAATYDSAALDLGGESPADDLPAPAFGFQDSQPADPDEVFSDLPGQLTQSAPSAPLFGDLPMPSADGELGDPPGSDLAGLPDLPEAAALAPDLMTDLPGVDTAASVTDQPEQETISVQTPDLTRAPQDAASTPEARGDGAAEATSAPPRRRRWLLGAAVLGLLLIVGGASAAYVFVLRGPSAPPPAKPKPVKQVAKAATPAPEATQEAQAEPALPPLEVPPLDESNVNTLTYAQLRAAVDKLDGDASNEKSRGLLLWASYRLSLFGDAKARAALAQAPAPPAAARLGMLAAAAATGKLALDGKTGPARTQAERLLRSRFKGAAPLYLVAASTYTRPAEHTKAQKSYGQALAAIPKLYEAQLGLARLQLQRAPSAEAGEKAMLSLAQGEDPALTLRVAQILIDAGKLEAADEAAATLNSTLIERVPPSQRENLLALLVRASLRHGDLDSAVMAARKRVDLAPASISAAIELIRLLASDDAQQATEAIKAAEARLKDPEAQGRLLVEAVHLALAQDDLAAAKAKIASAAKLASGKSAAWVKYADGLVAARAGKAQEARTAFNAARAAQPGFKEPQLAQLLLVPGKPGPTMAALTVLAKRSALPGASYHLARQMMAAGNNGGAVTLLDEVLWRDPTVVDPDELFGAWLKALATSGALARAAELAKAWHEHAPKRTAPLETLLAIAERVGKADDVLTWGRQLLELDPKKPRYVLGLASALIDAGKSEEARSLLEQLAKDRPEARDARLVYLLGKSWIEHDVVKARSLLKESLIKEPRAQTYAALGSIETSQGRVDEAEAAYKRALELDPSLTDVRLALARSFAQKGELEAATTQLRQLLARKPQDEKASELLGDVLMDLSNPKEAAAAYKTAAAGNDPAVLMKLARVQLQSLGQLAPATKTLKHVLAVDAKQAEAQYYLGLALKDLGKTKEAKTALESYLKLAPEGELAADAKRYIDDLSK